MARRHAQAGVLDDDSHHGEGAERIHVRVAASEVLVHVLRGCGLGHGSSIVTRGCPESLWLSRGGNRRWGRVCRLRIQFTGVHCAGCPTSIRAQAKGRGQA